MSFVYVVEDGAVIGISGGLMMIRYPDNTEEHIPKETVQGIAIYGKSHLTSQCIQFCLEQGIKVSYYSRSGMYYGCLTSTYQTKVHRQRLQFELTMDQEFRVSVAKKIISAKINNQMVVIKRYMKPRGLIPKELLFPMRNSKRKIEQAVSLQQIMGYEGIASRNYFGVIAQIIEPDFSLKKRNRRPATDNFNAMLNLGYSVLAKEIYGHIENRGMNAFFGFLHSDGENHPTLASDMMEEWRAPIVDSVVLSLIQGHEVTGKMFHMDEEGNCLMTKEGIKILFQKLEAKMYTEISYLSYFDKPVTFRKALWHQADRMAKMIDHKNPEIYKPVMIR